MADLPAQWQVTPPQKPFDLTIDDLPGSKSLTNRALVLGALADGRSKLRNVLFSDDTRVMLEALGRLGFDTTADEPHRTVEITGRAGTIPASEANLSLGNSGTSVRFLTALCCRGTGSYVIDGVERMRQRPIGQLVEPLRMAGGRIEYLRTPGYPPLRTFDGLIRGGTLRMTELVSSQYVTALLLIAPTCPEGLTIELPDHVVSRPYIEMTIAMMRQFGVETRRKNTTLLEVDHATYQPCDYGIEPDASNASYFLAAAAIVPGSRVTVRGIGADSVQGDAFFARDVLGPMGAAITFEGDAVTVRGVDRLTGIDIDLAAMPDMAQTLAVVALFAEGRTVIRNIGNLRVKETDRLKALENELTRLGAQADVRGDNLHITPPADGELTPALIRTYDDHRMAMSFAIAGLRSEGVVIHDPACVRKTFPDYFDFLARLGVQLHPTAPESTA